jgi:NADH-quinone oxidoreductase subunit N
MFFDAPAKNDRLVTSWSLGTSITLAVAALLVITVVAQLILNLASPAAQSLLTSLPK